MNVASPSLSIRSPWPHRWAWLLACATFPLIWVGGLVTTTGAGMAFKDWLTSDGHFMLFYPWLEFRGGQVRRAWPSLVGSDGRILGDCLGGGDLQM